MMPLPPTQRRTVVDVKTKSRTTDGQGGWTYTMSTGKTVSGLLNSKRAWQGLVAGQEQSRATHTFVTEYDALVQSKLSSGLADAVLVVDPGGQDRQFSITGVGNPGEMNVLIEIDCTESRVATE